MYSKKPSAHFFTEVTQKAILKDACQFISSAFCTVQQTFDAEKKTDFLNTEKKTEKTKQRFRNTDEAASSS